MSNPIPRTETFHTTTPPDQVDSQIHQHPWPNNTLEPKMPIGDIVLEARTDASGTHPESLAASPMGIPLLAVHLSTTAPPSSLETKGDLILEKLVAMTRHFDEKFEKMDERLERLEAHAVHVDNQLERLEAHAVHVDNQLERLQAHAVGMDERLDRMDENIKTELRSAGKNFEDLAEYLKVMNESLQNQLRGLTIKIDKVESGAELLCRELLDDDTENREAHASIGAEHERIRDLIYRLRPCRCGSQFGTDLSNRSYSTSSTSV